MSKDHRGHLWLKPRWRGTGFRMKATGVFHMWWAWLAAQVFPRLERWSSARGSWKACTHNLNLKHQLRMSDTVGLLSKQTLAAFVSILSAWNWLRHCLEGRAAEPWET